MGKAGRRHRRPARTKRVTRASPVQQVPCLPRKRKVDVTKCCHAKCLWRSPSATPATQKTAASPGTSADQEPAQWCHACHANARSMSPSATLATKWPWMSPSATHATQKTAASPATSADQARHKSQPSAVSAMPATQTQGRCHQVPRLPHQMALDISKLCVCVCLCVCVGTLRVSMLCVSDLCVCVCKLCVWTRVVCGQVVCVCEYVVCE